MEEWRAAGLMKKRSLLTNAVSVISRAKRCVLIFLHSARTKGRPAAAPNAPLNHPQRLPSFLTHLRMRPLRTFLCARHPLGLRFAHRRVAASATSVKPNPSFLPPPAPPRPPQRPVPFSNHGITWHDPYSWMSNLSDSVSMRHMDVYMEQEEKYTEAVMASTGADRLLGKIQVEMAPRMSSDLCTPPIHWGPWLYYRRVQEGKPFLVLCRRKASLQEEFISYNAPSAGFDFTSGKRIEQKLLDYNIEAERFGGYSYEELSEISPDHRFLAYTMYDKEKDSFTLSVRDLADGTLLERPRADRVANLCWAKNGQALLYTVTNNDKRPHRIFCSMLGSTKDDVLILEESDENVYVNIRNTKDFQFITVNIFSNTSSKVYLIKAAEPLINMTLVWVSEPHSNCIIEHHRQHLYLFTNAAKGGVPVNSHYLLHASLEASISRNWEVVFLEEPAISLEDVDFCDTHMVLVLKEGKRYGLCSISLPLLMATLGPVHLEDLNPCFLPLPEHVCQIQFGPNYDYYSSVMRFVISSPVMPDATVDYNLLNGKWKIVQQQNVLLERTKTLYGVASSGSIKPQSLKNLNVADDVYSSDGTWNELTEFYACEYYDVSSEDGVMVPLTVVYSQRHKQEDSPALLHGHGAYGELLDKRWRTELKSLLDRGWVVAYADVRGGGGGGRKWHHDGMRLKKQNSIMDYISCSEFLIKEGIVHKNKLAGWGYSVGGLLVAAAINARPELFRAAILKAPFLDPVNTLLYPLLPLTPVDYDEFGYPFDLQDFLAIQKYSPYENIHKDAIYPSVMVTSSFNTRFGVWEAVKWAARVRELTTYDSLHPVVLNLTAVLVEDSKYLQSKELAMETAFLIKMVADP